MHFDYLIIGGGQAGCRAAEALRAQTPDASICLLGEEAELPYERPPLSKGVLLAQSGEEALFLHDADFYRQQRIELRLGCRAQRIDPAACEVQLADGSRLGYGKLLLATGSRARAFPGELRGAEPLYMRSLADARRLRGRLRAGRQLAIVGGGFIGLEVAAAARTLGCRVVLLEAAPWLLQRVMPRALGDFLHSLHGSAGVELHLNTKPQCIERTPRGLCIHAQQGQWLVDEVLVGIGAIPNTQLAEQAGLQVDGGIVVDAQCRTSAPHVFAAGDVTAHFNPLLGRCVRVESWQVAEQQPLVAALNMSGGNALYTDWPWLWSDQYQSNIQCLGIFDAVQPVLRREGANSSAFSLIQLDVAQRLQAVVCVNQGRDMALFKRLATKAAALDAGKLCDSSLPLRALL